MMTAIAILQILGAFVVGTFVRAALILAVVLVASLPVMAFAYVARAVQGFAARHHLLHA